MSKTRNLKILCQLQFHSLILLIILVAFTAALAPSSPFNSYSIFYNLDSYEEPKDWLKRGVTFATVWLANFFLWYCAIPVLNLVISCNVAMAFYALNALPNVFQKISMEFTSSIRNDSFRMSPPNSESGLIPKTFHRNVLNQSYREIQLICNLYNELHHHLIIASLNVSSMTSQIVYLFILVAYNTQEGIFIFLFALIVFLNAAAFDIACYGEAANVHTTAEKVLQELVRGRVRLLKRRTSRVWFSKFIQSCPPVGVIFFASSYFDRMVPLKIELFCMDKTAILLLLNS